MEAYSDFVYRSYTQLPAGLENFLDQFRLERKMPLLVEIPDRHGTGRSKDFITSYITEAIGLKL